jgi:hypothetical protein
MDKLAAIWPMLFIDNLIDCCTQTSEPEFAVFLLQSRTTVDYEKAFSLIPLIKVTNGVITTSIFEFGTNAGVLWDQYLIAKFIGILI